MTKFARLASLLAIAFLTLPLAAQAQATRTWVSGVGDDANPCSRTAPCKTFAGAISKTAASGEINVLDPGGFGALTITKAITIRADGVTGGVQVAGTNGFVVAAGASDVVQLVGMDINGAGSSGGSLAGIQFNSGATLIVDHCHIYGFQGAGGTGSGISFQPSGASRLEVVDSVIATNGSTGGVNGTSGNILVRPQAGGSATVQLTRVQLLNAVGAGFRADGTITGSGALTAELDNVLADGNANGGYVAETNAGGGAVSVLINESTASNSSGFGVKSNGATITLNRVTVTANAIGLATANNGVLASYSNNPVTGNTLNGAPTTTVTLQ